MIISDCTSKIECAAAESKLREHLLKGDEAYARLVTKHLTVPLSLCLSLSPLTPPPHPTQPPSSTPDPAHTHTVLRFTMLITGGQRMQMQQKPPLKTAGIFFTSYFHPSGGLKYSSCLGERIVTVRYKMRSEICVLRG